VLSSLMFGLRISLFVGLVSTALSLAIGVTLGLVAGHAGGWLDAFIMRVCDVMLSFPSILVALLIDGVGRALLPSGHDELAIAVLVAAIALTGWVPHARTVRGSTMVERQKDYVSAARLIGVPALRILRRHVLPNVLGPVLVLGTLQVGTAILIEATLSYLGVGVPATSPSLGTLIRIGNELMLSGDWWISVFPGLVLVLATLSINGMGDALRDALNPRLR
jgi:peptide/nickel transport system permease protein